MPDLSRLDSWRADPAAFVERYLVHPESGRPYVLLPAEQLFLQHALRFDDDGRMLYPLLVYGAPKKSGKSEFGAILTLVLTLLYGGRNAESFSVANDLEQSMARVFERCCRICEASPLLADDVKITASEIVLLGTGAKIKALASEYRSAAGSAPCVATFDELWGFVSERSRRLFDELVWSPTRTVSCRLVVSYAGFSGESELLEEIYKRGQQLPEIAPGLRGGDGMLFFWSHEPIAPWQDEKWLAQMRRELRPNQYLRMIENRFVTSESAFIPMAAWDRSVNPDLTPLWSDRQLPVWVGVDAAHKHDSAAIVAVTFDASSQLVRLVWHAVFQPTPEEPLDFEAAIEGTLLDLRKRFYIRKVRFDPWQMQAVAQRLAKMALPVEGYAQSTPNLTAASQNLYDLITSGGLLLYPDEAMRLAASQAVAIESPRGWRIAKEKQSHKIDVIVALGMAAHAALSGGITNQPLDYSGWCDKDEQDERTMMEKWRMQRYSWLYASHGLIRF